MRTVIKAKEFAFKYHEGQKYGIYPYTFHLNQVYNTLKYFGVTSKLILTASWLHDILEDTECLYEDLFEEFGKDVADLVYLVTDKRGKNRRERQEKTYPLITEDTNGRILKIADRIANMTQSQHEKEKQWLMYDKEYEYFRNTLYVGLPDKEIYADIYTKEQNMWCYLDGLVRQGHLDDE
jgi:(p)ppGpp synthase/HD superfamily hydrolase